MREEPDEYDRQILAGARNEIAKRGFLHFRIQPSYIERIYKVAGKEEKAVGAMLREWIIERLELEEQGKAQNIARRVVILEAGYEDLRRMINSRRRLAQ